MRSTRWLKSKDMVEPNLYLYILLMRSTRWLKSKDMVEPNLYLYILYTVKLHAHNRECLPVPLRAIGMTELKSGIKSIPVHCTTPRKEFEFLNPVTSVDISRLVWDCVLWR